MNSLDISQCKVMVRGIESRDIMFEIQRLFPEFLKLVPVSMQTRVLSAALNQLLRGQPLRMRLGELNDKTVSVNINDIPWRMDFHIRDRRIHTAVEGITPDVTISGGLQDFIALLRGHADPDALFFQRRLNMEGDTEAGVHIKNLLDSLEYDWDTHFDATLVPALADRAKRWRRGMRARFSKVQHDERNIV